MLDSRRVSFSNEQKPSPYGDVHHEDGDTEESKKHRTTKTLIQLEKAKQKPVSFAVLTKCGFDGEKYTDNDAPLPSKL